MTLWPYDVIIVRLHYLVNNHLVGIEKGLSMTTLYTEYLFILWHGSPTDTETLIWVSEHVFHSVPSSSTLPPSSHHHIYKSLSCKATTSLRSTAWCDQFQLYLRYINPYLVRPPLLYGQLRDRTYISCMLTNTPFWLLRNVINSSFDSCSMTNFTYGRESTL